MKKIIAFAAAALLSLSLAGCTLPGEIKNDDDFMPSMSYADVKDDSDKEAVINYVWSLKPSISADNIIVFDASQVDPDADEPNFMYKTTAVISRSGLYGLINYKGDILVNPSYKNYYLCSCGQIILYNVTDEENDVREYCTFDKDGKRTENIPYHDSSVTEYYFDEAAKKTYYASAADNFSVREYTGDHAVAAYKATIGQNGMEYYVTDRQDDPKYGIVKSNKAITEFEYDDYYAPLSKDPKETAIAVKKDGKWGYLKSNGKQLIDFRCDELYSSYNGEMTDSSNTSGHPYLFSEEMVPVSIGYSFGYYNLEGQCVVRTNEFEQARPVHYGKAWVCSDGLWGVIRFGDEIEEEAITMTTTTTTTTATWSQTSSTSSASDTSTDTEAVWTDTEPIDTDPIWTDTDPVWTDTDPVWTDTDPVWVDTDPVWTEDPYYEDPSAEYYW